MPTRANRDTNSYGMNVDNGARAPHTEIEDRFCQNIILTVLFSRLISLGIPILVDLLNLNRRVATRCSSGQRDMERNYSA